MKLDVIDKSNYLKGLLVLISKDNKISRAESDLVMTVSKTLGFDKEFTQEALDTLLENEYISQEPPKFNQREIAFSFIKDGIKLAVSDLNFDIREIEYLKATAEVNAISDEWLFNELNNADFEAKSRLKNEAIQLEVEKYI